MLLYSHYDVVPAGDESLWDTPPFEATLRDGALYGRGAGDTKSNIVAVIGALRAWDGRPPVGMKFVFEGLEEVGSGGFVHHALENPELSTRTPWSSPTWAACDPECPRSRLRCAAWRT